MVLPKIYFPHIVPLLCLIAGLVLVNLCIVAGNKPGFMEDYALVRVCPFPPFLFCTSWWYIGILTW